MRESAFQKRIIAKLKQRFGLDGCMILKNDADYKPGIPDLLILYGDRWAMLEVKRSETAPHRPNQDYYVDKLNDMSFAAFIYPENEEEVLDELEQAFQSRR